MKIHKYPELDSIEYPVGSNMSYNISIIKKMVSIIKRNYNDKPINLFCQGSSGAIVAAIICLYVNGCKIIHIKKDGEDSHSLSCPQSDSYNIIVDDFIVSGATIQRIIEETARIHYIREFDALIVSDIIREKVIKSLTNVEHVYCKDVE